MLTTLRTWVRSFGLPGVLALLVTAFGLGLRIEHALTFDGPTKGSDYAVYMQGVRWMLEHKRAFHFDPTVNGSVSYQPPLWYAAAAGVLAATDSERSIAALSVLGWLVRQVLLALFMRKAAPEARWSALAVLSLHAVLPLSVLIDGKVNPEGTHATLFMAAAYVLWLIERRTTATHAIARGLAAAFGVLAGLALLTKATSSILTVAFAVLVAWFAARSLSRAGWSAAFREVLRPALAAALVWTLVVFFWVAPNLVLQGHPFPHAWHQNVFFPGMNEPVLYRRPLGWALPFEWSAYFETPVIRDGTVPRPNFWSAVITGTWTDFYNRGFCRLKGGATIETVWGGLKSIATTGPGWGVSERCFQFFRVLLAVGLPITLGCVVAVFHTLGSFVRSNGTRGSLVLPTCIALGTLFSMLFAMAYPVDLSAVTNPRYLLPVQGLVLACAGMALGRLEASRWKRLALALAFLAVAAVAALLVYERFG